MRRENRRREDKNKEKIIDNKLIKYTAIAVSILAVIVVILFAYSKSLNRRAEEGALTSKQISNILNSTQDENAESASTEIGKSVEESKNEIPESDYVNLSDENNSNLPNKNENSSTLNSANKNDSSNSTTKNSVADSKANSSSNATKTNGSNSSNGQNSSSNNVLKTNKITPVADAKRTDIKTNNSAETSENGESAQTVQLNFEMPVAGDIVRDFAVENLIFSETLQEWTTHTGIDIKADKTTVVKSAEAGTVKTIKNDPRYGLTITVEHENGFQTVYSNLLSSEFVVEGEKVEKGQALGTVGNTAAFESSDEPHLHFEIIKDSVQIDPRLYLK